MTATLSGSVLVALLFSSGFTGVQGHGYMSVPLARNGNNNGANSGGSCGGWNAKKALRATYTAGQVATFKHVITAHHAGHHEMRICNRTLTGNDDACLNQWVLQRAEPPANCSPNDARTDCQPIDRRHPERFYLPPRRNLPQTDTFRYIIPEGLACQACTIQWRWWTANSCVPLSDYGCYWNQIASAGWNSGNFHGYFAGTPCGPKNANQPMCNNGGEQFINCADIRVLPGTPTPAPPPPPPISAFMCGELPCYLNTQGLDECQTPSGETFGESNCEVRATQLLAALGVTPLTPMNVGSWSHLPPGCSIRADLSAKVHYNRNSAGVNRGDMSLICKDADLVVDPQPTPAPTPQPPTTPAPPTPQPTPAPPTPQPTPLPTPQPTPAPGPPAYQNPEGSNECHAGNTFAESACADAGARMLAELGLVLENNDMNVGSWSTLPPGCSIRGDLSAKVHYNRNSAGVNRGDMSLICTREATPTPQPTPAPVPKCCKWASACSGSCASGYCSQSSADCTSCGGHWCGTGSLLSAISEHAGRSKREPKASLTIE